MTVNQEGGATPADCLTPDDIRTLREVARKLGDPSLGLPDPVFEFALAVTPMVNVDLLTLDPAGRFLLAWRVDRWGAGWHVPGGIIRKNESIDHRIARVAQLELGLRVRATRRPLDLTPFFGERGHFISLLYACAPDGEPSGPRLVAAGAAPSAGALHWFEAPPGDIYPSHGDYVRSIPARIGPALSRLAAEA